MLIEVPVRSSEALSKKVPSAKPAAPAAATRPALPKTPTNLDALAVVANGEPEAVFSRQDIDQGLDGT